MTLAELQEFSAIISEDVFDVLTLQGSMAARNHQGGTAPEQVRSAVAAARQRLQGRQP
jgi:argininosuccinate lyase